MTHQGVADKSLQKATTGTLAGGLNRAPTARVSAQQGLHRALQQLPAGLPPHLS